MTTENEEMTEQQRTDALAKLGLELKILSGPEGRIDGTGKDKPWIHLAYRVRILFQGREILETEFKMGIGNVDLKRPIRNYTFTSNEVAMIEAWQRKPFADFRDKELQASVAGKLAIQQKLFPSLASVFYCLLSDGEAFFNGLTFEDWCDEFGVDSDSRKAEETFRACDATGRKLGRIPKAKLEQARAIMEGF